MQENQVPDVNDRSCGLPQDEHWITAVEGVGEERDTAHKTEVPERSWDVAAARLLACNPLVEEPRGKHRLPTEPDCEPRKLSGGQCCQSLKPEFDTS